MIGKPEDKLLKSFTGLEGGIVATGSTCGVVSGGAIGLALSHYDEIMETGIPAQAGLLALIGEYVKWFEKKFGTSCESKNSSYICAQILPRCCGLNRMTLNPRKS